MKYLIYVIFLFIILFNVYNLGKKSVEPTIIEKVEIIKRTDTITIYKPIPDTVYLTKIVKDTLYSTDSTKTEVDIPITTTIYKDSTYEASVSGFKANLDYVKVFPTQTTIYKEKTLEIKEKQPLIKHGVQVGVGYGMINNKPDFYIGYGISINF